MHPTEIGTLRVPGATLYYQGTRLGPHTAYPPVILQGGDGDAEGSDGIADQLIDHHDLQYVLAALRPDGKIIPSFASLPGDRSR